MPHDTWACDPTRLRPCSARDLRAGAVGLPGQPFNALLTMGRSTPRIPFIKRKTPAVRTGFDKKLGLYFAEHPDGSARVMVSDRKRLSLYEDGLDHRRQWILGDYRIPVDLVGPGDVVVDVGANIGEIGLWAESRGARYIAFEPDPRAFAALEANVASEHLHQVALSDKTMTAEFYLDTARADSSLFAPARSDESITVDVVPLDEYLSSGEAPERIKLLKVEAEGLEPEILRGARTTLSTVDYLAVDAGPERGGDNTVPGVFAELSGLGFRVIDCYLKRGTFLFRREPAGGVGTI